MGESTKQRIKEWINRRGQQRIRNGAEDVSVGKSSNPGIESVAERITFWASEPTNGATREYNNAPTKMRLRNHTPNQPVTQHMGELTDRPTNEETNQTAHLPKRRPMKSSHNP